MGLLEKLRLKKKPVEKKPPAAEKALEVGVPQKSRSDFKGVPEVGVPQKSRSDFKGVPEVEEKIPLKEEEKQGTARQSKDDTGQAYQILLKPVLSEKGTHLAGSGNYVFSVNPKANKSEVKKSIQKVYNVHVEKVRIVNLPRKKRRYGRTKGQTRAIKKAIVQVRKGEKISGIIESVG